MTREITMIVVHCSATRCNHPYTVYQLYHDHVEVNHWRYIGYHFFISRDGKVHATRPLERIGVQKACPSFDATTLQPLLHLNCKY